MKLLTKEVERRLGKFPLKSQDGKGFDAEIVVKFFDPTGRYTLYVTEAELQVVETCDYGCDHNHADAANRCLHEKTDWYLWGYCLSPLGSDCDEWGPIMLSELAKTKVRFGLGIERDMHLSNGRTVRQELSVMGIEK